MARGFPKLEADTQAWTVLDLQEPLWKGWRRAFFVSTQKEVHILWGCSWPALEPRGVGAMVEADLARSPAGGALLTS